MQYCLERLYDHRGRYEIVKGQISGEITLCKRETREKQFLEKILFRFGGRGTTFDISCFDNIKVTNIWTPIL